ncbi:N-acetyltransferase family protein [Tropicimonas sp. S265A]|uniref:GNAT family N-acetyltransferase n=1 Tax=Tropicimonas sp. S265A TaxID=3415134 RepID=UPI003C7DFB8C
MTPRIASASAADAAGIAALWSGAIRDTDITFNSVEKTEADILALMAQRAEAGHAFLAVRDGAGVIGFAGYGPFRPGVGYARTVEHTIFLSDRARGHGLGRRVMAQIEAHARAGGAHSIWGGISGTNTDSIAFHEALGFSQMALLPEVGFKFGRLMDLVLVRKLL